MDKKDTGFRPKFERSYDEDLENDVVEPLAGEEEGGTSASIKEMYRILQDRGSVQFRRVLVAALIGIAYFSIFLLRATYIINDPIMAMLCIDILCWFYFTGKRKLYFALTAGYIVLAALMLMGKLGEAVTLIAIVTLAIAACLVKLISSSSDPDGDEW